MARNYDIIITGGGAGGLSFVSHLLDNPLLQDKRVLIIDRDHKNVNDKTWCYWSKEPLPYPGSHVKEWSKCEIGREGKYVYRSTGEYKYREISSLLFYKEVQKRIDQKPSVDRIIANVLDIDPQLGKCLVTVDDGIFEAGIVINSIPGLMQQVPAKHYFNQNFKGVRIKTKNATFDPEVASLMDFHKTDDPCLSSFFYVLPYSDKEALIEYTRFSTEVGSSESYDPYIGMYLKEKYGVEAYEVLETEMGVIPMTDFPYQAQPHPRVFQIGTIAGDTKPTTGYTFHFIQQRAKEIANNLSEPHYSALGNSVPKRFRFYDQLLLSIMVREPNCVKDIMFTLFGKVSLPLILRFLDEKTSIWEEARIFLTLPKRLFISAIFIRKPKLYATTKKTTLDSTVRRTFSAVK